MKTYLTWSTNVPTEMIEAPSSFVARKTFAAKHKLAVTDCMARASSEPRNAMNFNYEAQTVETTEQSLLVWIQALHGVLVNAGAWDRLAAFDTETAQQLEILARKAETI